jgi:hypothetical protein
LVVRGERERIILKTLSYLPFGRRSTELTLKLRAGSLRKGEDEFPSFVKRVHPEGSP